MNDHSTYEALRHLADSWGLAVMFVMFIGFVGWAFRPGAAERYDDTAKAIFKDDEDGE